MAKKVQKKPFLKALQVSAVKNSAFYQYNMPNRKVLERFPTPVATRPNAGIAIRIEAPEFTSLCPITGQPDFAEIMVEYIPDKWCVESKSLKLYLMGYRQYGAFHEAITQKICDDLVTLLDPKKLTVAGNFVPRGGIAFKPVATFIK